MTTTIHNSFDNLNLKENILKGVYLYGFVKPSKIQIEGIQSINTGRDCILQSQSGTGKTCTYLLGILNKLTENSVCQGIILSPTRELAEQIYNVGIEITKYTKLKIELCIGGINIQSNLGKLKRCNLIIATIGRLYHMVKDNYINLKSLKVFAIDEADNIIGNEVNDKFTFILSKLPKTTQSVLISATVSHEFLKNSATIVKDPIKILVDNSNITVDLIKQYYLNIEYEDNKFDVILDLYNLFSTSQVIIFCNTIRKVNWLIKKLEEENFTITSIHGKMSYTERVETIKEFRNGNTRILLTTDLLARGIDIPQVNMIINYDLPIDKETYVHRIGRCGRFDKKGIAITMVKMKDQSDYNIFKKMKNIYNLQISELPENITID